MGQRAKVASLLADWASASQTRSNGRETAVRIRLGLETRGAIPLLTVLLLQIGTPAAAQDYSRFQLTAAQERAFDSPPYNRCLDSSGGVTIHMRNCAAAELDRLDVRLNQSYRAAISRLPNRATKIGLRNLQRRWLRTRWEACHRQVDEDPAMGGTLGLIVLDGCEISEVQRRIGWLEAYGRRR
jgi:uncharacterized protein YecT (DUF1311 family)